MHVFETFNFLIQIAHFAKAIAFACWPISRFSKTCHFFNIRGSFDLFFSQNNSNVILQSSYASF